MTYTEYNEMLKEAHDNLYQWYGDYGIELEPKLAADGMTICDVSISWPSVNASGMYDTYRFSEALSAAALEAARLIGLTVE